MFKVDNKIPELFIVNLEQISHLVLLFPLSILNNLMPAGQSTLQRTIFSFALILSYSETFSHFVQFWIMQLLYQVFIQSLF